MTDDEFREWLAFHTSAYPAVAKWLGENERTLPFWRGTLERVSLAAAQQATEELFQGDEQPRGHSDHPRFIRRIAQRIEADRGDRRTETPACEICKVPDETRGFRSCGIVSVAHYRTVAQALDGEIPDNLASMAVRCTCSAGERYRSLPRFSPGRMHPYTARDYLESAADLQEFALRLPSAIVSLYREVAGKQHRQRRVRVA